MCVYHTGSSAATQSESVSGPSSHRERNRISMNRPAPALQCLKIILKCFTALSQLQSAFNDNIDRSPCASTGIVVLSPVEVKGDA